MKEHQKQIYTVIIIVAIIFGTLAFTNYFYNPDRNKEVELSQEENSSNPSELSERIINETPESIEIVPESVETLIVDSYDVSKDIYTVCQRCCCEFGVETVLSHGCENMGNGHLHVQGPEVFFGQGSVMAKLEFGFNNPYFEKSGAPVSYIVKARIGYKNWNDENGLVVLYIEKDDGTWELIWGKVGLATGGSESWWDVTWESSSTKYFRDDGTTNFIIRGYSITPSAFIIPFRPTFRIDVSNLRVQLNYDNNNDIFPLNKVYAIYKQYESVEGVHEIVSTGGSNLGDGQFHIKGYLIAMQVVEVIISV